MEKIDSYKIDREDDNESISVDCDFYYAICSGCVVELTDFAFITFFLVLYKGLLKKLLKLSFMAELAMDQTYFLEDKALAFRSITELLVILKGLTPSLQFLAARCQLFKHSL